MITATLTTTRHIAGATAAYQATIPSDPEATPPYASVDAYVQAAIERVADSWVESTKVDQISVGDFILRFTPAEFAAITGAAVNDANVAAILATLRARLRAPRLGGCDKRHRLPRQRGPIDAGTWRRGAALLAQVDALFVAAGKVVT